MKNQPNVLMTLSALCGVFLTHTGLSASKVHFEHLHSSYVGNPPDDTSDLNKHKSPSFGSLLVFFNVNNKTILYPCTERTDGALVRRVSRYVLSDFAAVVHSLSSYCRTAVN